MTKLKTLKARHRREERDLVREALRQTEFYLYPAAELLGVRVSALQRLLQRHPELEAERDRVRPPEERPAGRAAE